jgi:hypothetical protein
MGGTQSPSLLYAKACLFVGVGVASQPLGNGYSM